MTVQLYFRILVQCMGGSNTISDYFKFKLGPTSKKISLNLKYSITKG